MQDQFLLVLIGVLSCCILFPFLLGKYNRSQQMHRQLSFYKGDGTEQEPKRKWQFWLPLFLYRRRRRSSGNRLRVKHLRRC